MTREFTAVIYWEEEDEVSGSVSYCPELCVARPVDHCSVAQGGPERNPENHHPRAELPRELFE